MRRHPPRSRGPARFGLCLAWALPCLGLGACGLDPELHGPRSEGAQIAGALWARGTPVTTVEGMQLRVVDLGDGRRAAVRSGGAWYPTEAAFVTSAQQALAQVAGCPVGRTEVLSPVGVAGEVDCSASAPDAGEDTGG